MLASVVGLGAGGGLAACGPSSATSSSGSSGSSGGGTGTVTTTPGAATTVPGSTPDPLTAPASTPAQLESGGGPAGGGSGTPVPVVTPPGVILLSASEIAALPVVRVGAWQLLGRTADNRYLLVEVTYGGCDRLAALAVAAGSTAVTITPRLRAPSGVTVCPQIAALARFVVDLGAPLGGRTLLHPPPFPS